MTDYDEVLEHIAEDGNQKFHDLAVRFAGIMEMVDEREWAKAAEALTAFIKEGIDVATALWLIASIKDDHERNG